MKSLMRLILCVLADASIWCCTSTTRDWLTITRRVKHEGLSFLTITLPSFCSDFERSLADGCVVPSSFIGFHRNRDGALPRFLSGLLEQVFDAGTGVVLDKPNIQAIYYIRQICLLLKKVELPCSTQRVEEAYERYIQCESEVRQDSWTAQDLSDFVHISGMLWSEVLSEVNRKVISGDLIPRHGPGATAERISRNDKYNLRQWNERLQPFFPFDMFGIPNHGFLDMLEGVHFTEPGAELPVRVITVPKTLKTPRIIAIEPVCMQYTQQALMAPIVKALEGSPLTGGFVNFTDQTVNQSLALSSSSDGRFATIDLKDASDRVSASLVYSMLSCVPDLRDAVFACRSTTADVPGHGVQHLAKFASMGSALCFPIESMVFYTISLLGIMRSKHLQISKRNLLRVLQEVRVYGDDIIVPTEFVLPVTKTLEEFNLRVNTRKTFGTGKFRESCGMDAYDGVPVTPVYCRRTGPLSRRDTSEILSWISLGNQLYKAGSWKAAEYVRSHVNSIIRVPVVEETSPISGWFSYLNQIQFQRICPSLQKPLVLGPVVRLRHKKSMLDGPNALMKVFLKRGDEPFPDAKHLERHGRPESVDIKIQWASPY